MKHSSLLFIALFLVGGAFGQLIVATYFVDTACQTMAANPVGGVANPFSVNLNACVKSLGGYYAKATSCASGSFSSTTYRMDDTSCTNAALATTNDRTNTCIALSPPMAGVNSYRISCSVSSANSLQSSAALFVAVALVVYF